MNGQELPLVMQILIIFLTEIIVFWQIMKNIMGHLLNYYWCLQKNIRIDRYCWCIFPATFSFVCSILLCSNCFLCCGKKSLWYIYGLIGCLMLVLSPRIFSDAFFNSKDLAFLSLFTIGLYFLLNLSKTQPLNGHWFMHLLREP